MTGPRKMPKGRLFKKGQSGNPSGKRKNSTSWKEAEEALREAIPRLMNMEQNELKLLLQSNPKGYEVLAAKYIVEHVPQTVERFLGKTPTQITGKDGEPLMPKPAAPILPVFDFTGPLWTGDRLDAFIEATAKAIKKPTPAAAPAAPAPTAPADEPPSKPA